MQNDFCEGGSLAIQGASEIIPIINKLKHDQRFQKVIYTRDWHPIDHCSFQANHPGSKLFETITLPETGVEQVMWPTHCVQNTRGAELHHELDIQPIKTDLENQITVISKGQLRQVDSYSGFGNYPEQTDLKDRLITLAKQRFGELENIKNLVKVYCVGLAFDYCVGSTAIDSAKLGFETFILKDATRSAGQESEEKMIQKINEAGVKIIKSEDFI
eukprot:403338452